MTKKPAFKPLVHAAGHLTKPQEIVEIHDKARDYREREALIFPDRIKDKTHKWEY